MTILQDETEVASSRKADLLDELNKGIHRNLRFNFVDRAMHQGLIILAALAGFVALAVGFFFPDSARLARAIGAVPSVATILIQQLRCIKAQNWHARMANEMDGIKARLLYELPAVPSLAEIGGLSGDLRNIKTKMTAEWEPISESQAPSSPEPPEPERPTNQ